MAEDVVVAECKCLRGCCVLLRVCVRDGWRERGRERERERGREEGRERGREGEREGSSERVSQRVSRGGMTTPLAEVQEVSSLCV